MKSVALWERGGGLVHLPRGPAAVGPTRARERRRRIIEIWRAAIQRAVMAGHDA